MVMKFSVGNIFRKAPAQEGPRVAGRTDFGGEFMISPGECFVVEDTMVTNLGIISGKMALGIRVGDRSGRLELPVNEGSRESNWFEYSISPVNINPSMQAKMSVRKNCQNARPITYDSDFWLKAGESAAFEHGLIVTNKSISKSRMGEFTNVTLGLEHGGRKNDVMLTGFAKGKEKFVFSDRKNSVAFGQFDITMNSVSNEAAVLNVRYSSNLLLLGASPQF